MRVPSIRRAIADLVDAPLLRRIAWYARRARKNLDRRFLIGIAIGILSIVILAGVAITALEKPWSLESFGASGYWAITTIFGQGESSYVRTPVGWVVSWLLILFGVALLGMLTGALVAILIDFLLKEGQGMGASGYRGHVVVCGWNATARDLVAELRGDERHEKIVLVHDSEKSPAGDGVYFVKGDPTDPDDLARAGIADAGSVVVFPREGTNDADMRSLLAVTAIHASDTKARIIVEVVNPKHVRHFEAAGADEILVTSRLASRLLARSALYPGLTALVTDIVSGGEGSELYRVTLPDDYLGLSIDDVSARLRAEHRATLLSICRNNAAFVNPSADFRLEHGDDAVVVAESLGTLAPLELEATARRAAPGIEATVIASLTTDRGPGGGAPA